MDLPPLSIKVGKLRLPDPDPGTARLLLSTKTGQGLLWRLGKKIAPVIPIDAPPPPRSFKEMEDQAKMFDRVIAPRLNRVKLLSAIAGASLASLVLGASAYFLAPDQDDLRVVYLPQSVAEGQATGEKQSGAVAEAKVDGDSIELELSPELVLLINQEIALRQQRRNLEAQTQALANVDSDKKRQEMEAQAVQQAEAERKAAEEQERLRAQQEERLREADAQAKQAALLAAQAAAEAQAKAKEREALAAALRADADREAAKRNGTTATAPKETKESARPPKPIAEAKPSPVRRQEAPATAQASSGDSQVTVFNLEEGRGKRSDQDPSMIASIPIVDIVMARKGDRVAPVRTGQRLPDGSFLVSADPATGTVRTTRGTFNIKGK